MGVVCVRARMCECVCWLGVSYRTHHRRIAMVRREMTHTSCVRQLEASLSVGTPAADSAGAFGMGRCRAAQVRHQPCTAA